MAADTHAPGFSALGRLLVLRERLIARAALVCDWQLFGFALLWVICGGLLLQLVVLPYLAPSLHAGHGLLKRGDWVRFHRFAVKQAALIAEYGWGRWELRPAGLYPAGMASVMYVLLKPSPWAVLPLNGALFAVAVVATRRTIAAMVGSRGAALLGLAPFFLFPSFVPIWGQIHRDVTTGAGFSLTLCALALSRPADGRRYPSWLLALLFGCGMGLVWLGRPYAQALVVVSAMAFVAVMAVTDRTYGRRIVALIAVGVLLAAVSFTARVSRTSGLRLGRSATPEMIRDKAQLRHEECRPLPTGARVDLVLFALCEERERFKESYQAAGSAIDLDVSLRSPIEFALYVPRAVEVAVFEPGPARWGRSASPIGRIGVYLVPFEMLTVYAGLCLLAFRAARGRVRRETWAVIVFCVVYGAIYVYGVPNLGALYRMRAFAFATMAGACIGAILAPASIALRPNAPEAATLGPSRPV
ncbi:MAG: hypothetical protein AB7J63_05775 [Vicinamibacterales bacterium]